MKCRPRERARVVHPWLGEKQHPRAGHGSDVGRGMRHQGKDKGPGEARPLTPDRTSSGARGPNFIAWSGGCRVATPPVCANKINGTGRSAPLSQGHLELTLRLQTSTSRLRKHILQQNLEAERQPQLPEVALLACPRRTRKGEGPRAEARGAPEGAGPGDGACPAGRAGPRRAPSPPPGAAHPPRAHVRRWRSPDSPLCPALQMMRFIYTAPL